MDSSAGGDGFPMFTVPLPKLLEMRAVRRHEELLESGEVCEFQAGMGRAMFISHQWLGLTHPDPDGQQLQVLKNALVNLMSGQTVVCVPPGVEIVVGRQTCPSTSDFHAQPLYIWYDYFSCPQGHGAQASKFRQLAINSIPSYVERSFFVVILCPTVACTQGGTLGYSSWRSRGWCRPLSGHLTSIKATSEAWKWHRVSSAVSTATPSFYAPPLSRP